MKKYLPFILILMSLLLTACEFSIDNRLGHIPTETVIPIMVASQPSQTPMATSISKVFEGKVSTYQPLTTMCVCDNCAETVFLAKIDMDSVGHITGGLYYKEYPSVPFSTFEGTKDLMVGQTVSMPNSCDAIGTTVLSAKIINDRFEGTLETTFTPGNCHMDECGDMYSFSLPQQ